MKHKNNIKLYDTYLTDITPLGGGLILKDEGKEEYFSRTYQKGEVSFGGYMFEAECISFESGNVQITDVSGDEEGISAFLQMHYDRQQRRRPILMLRKFFQYLYILAAPSIGLLAFLSLCHLQFGKFFLGFVIELVLRLLYSETRNKLR